IWIGPSLDEPGNKLGKQTRSKGPQPFGISQRTWNGCEVAPPTHLSGRARGTRQMRAAGVTLQRKVYGWVKPWMTNVMSVALRKLRVSRRWKCAAIRANRMP